MVPRVLSFSPRKQIGRPEMVVEVFLVRSVPEAEPMILAKLNRALLVNLSYCLYLFIYYYLRIPISTDCI
jgi:hypothetical protein